MNDLINRTIDFLQRQQEARYHDGEADIEGLVDEKSDTIFVGKIFFMEKLTHLLEERILQDKLTQGRFFVSFLGFDAFRRRLQRYSKITALGNRLWVYGKKNGEDIHLANARFIPLEADDAITRCWFMIYSNGTFESSLVAIEKHDTSSHKHKEYKGFWTTKESITNYLIDYLTHVVNVQYSTEVDTP